MEHLTGYVPDQREFAAAADRLTATAGEHGGAEPAAVAWLLGFAQSDAFGFSQTERALKFWDVLRFAADGGQGGADYGQSGGLLFQPPATAEAQTIMLSELQNAISDGLAKYLRVGVASFPKDEAGFTIARGYRSVLFSGRSLPAAFFYMSAQLLARYGHRIKPCEGCSLIMLVGRKDQRFHSQSCQISTFIRKKRAEEKTKRLAREQRKLKNAKHKKAVKKTMTGKKPKQLKGEKHGTQR